MPHKNRLPLTEYVEHADQVTNKVEQRIHSRITGLVGLAVSAQVGCDDVVASMGQRGEFVPAG